MDSLVISKVGTIFALIALTLLFGTLPFILLFRNTRSLVPSRQREKVIKYLNCFGGGVFLGALLLHLMIEGSEEFEKYKEEIKYDSPYPYFNLFVATGFFAVALLEYLIHTYLLSTNEMVNGHSHSHSHSHFTDSAIGYNRCSSAEAHDRNVAVVVSGSRYGSVDSRPPPNFVAKNMPNVDDSLNIATEEHSDENTSHISPPQSQPLERSTEGPLESSISGTCAVSYSHASDASPFKAFLLLVALSFHTIFDGLAIGLQVSTFNLWEMFVAIAVHKGIMAFCLGLELFAKYLNTPKRAVFWLGIFSLMSPIGISIGIGLTSGSISSMKRHLSSAILQGLAAGTFMYVTFLEILSVSWQSSHYRRSFLEIFFALVGFACMAGVKALEKD